jgi:hypothetical protein
MNNDDQIIQCLKHLKTDIEKVYFLDEQIKKLNTSAHIVALLGRRKMAEDIVNKISDLQKKKSQIYNNRRTP